MNWKTSIRPIPLFSKICFCAWILGKRMNWNTRVFDIDEVFRIGIQFEQIRAIPKFVSKPFRVAYLNWKLGLNPIHSHWIVKDLFILLIFEGIWNEMKMCFELVVDLFASDLFVINFCKRMDSSESEPFWNLFPNHSVSFQTNSKNVLNLVCCQSVGNQSDSIWMNLK